MNTSSSQSKSLSFIPEKEDRFLEITDFLPSVISLQLKKKGRNTSGRQNISQVRMKMRAFFFLLMDKEHYYYITKYIICINNAAQFPKPIEAL